MQGQSENLLKNYNLVQQGRNYCHKTDPKDGKIKKVEKILKTP